MTRQSMDPRRTTRQPLTIFSVSDLADRWGVSTGCIYSRLYRMRQSHRRLASPIMSSYRDYHYARRHGPAALHEGRLCPSTLMPLWHRDDKSRQIWFYAGAVLRWERTTPALEWLARQTYKSVDDLYRIVWYSTYVD